MNLVENVYKVAQEFMKNPLEVELNYEQIEKTANEMLSYGKLGFPESYRKNYCYWYGKDTVRPNGSSSALLYECIGNAFFDYTEVDQQKFNICLTRLINLLISNRFPLLEERMYHLHQLRLYAEDFTQKIMKNNDIENINDLMLELITLFPGFSSDIFLKRTFLFFMQMNRRFGWFEKAIQDMPVAADYQVPKMLEHFGCISYCPELKRQISFRKLIPKGSIEECEIRSATILACKKLCEITGWNIAEIDGFLWLKRHEVTTPFHLTITTDY